MRVYFDVMSIHNEMLRRFPDMDPNKSSCYLSSSTSVYATIADCTGLADGTEVEIGSERIVDYYGRPVSIITWQAKAIREEKKG